MSDRSAIRFTTHAPRSFIEFQGIGTLNEVKSVGSLPHTAPRDWEAWDEVSCVIVLGEPGSGKSTEFAHWCRMLQKNGQAAFSSRWQDWYDGSELFSTLEYQDVFFAAFENHQTVWWFLDALDEGRLKADRAFGVLVQALQALKNRGVLSQLRLRVSCRSRDWRFSEGQLLARLFSPEQGDDQPRDQVAAVQILPLDTKAIRVLTREKLENENAIERFLAALERRHVYPLAGHPLLLGMMLALFKQGNEELGRDRTELYEEAVRALTTEQNEYRGEAAVSTTLPTLRVEIALGLAACAVFAGQEALFIPDNDPAIPNALDASLASGDRLQLRETFGTSLFVRLPRGGFAFAHRSLAEYLAARRLADAMNDGLPLARVVPLFHIDRGTLPGPVRETAGWLAGLRPDFRRWLIDHDPLGAAQADTIRYTSEERTRLITALVQRFEGRSWQREFERYGDLARDVPSTLLTDLLRPNHTSAVRDFVIDLIDTGERSDLYSLLGALALDVTASASLRANAVNVVARKSPGDYSADLVTLLDLPETEDPDDEIAGHVLHHLYPAHLSTDAALRGLRFPRNPRLLGFFRYFWTRNLVQRVPGADRPKVLDALATLLTQDTDAIERREFATTFLQLLLPETHDEKTSIEQIGRWLLAYRHWGEHHGDADKHLHQQLLERLKRDTSLKNKLLRWMLIHRDQNKPLQAWWEVPFFESIFDENDTLGIAALCREYIGLPLVSIPLFETAVGLCMKTSSGLLDIFEELATLSSGHGAAWDTMRFCDLTAGYAKMLRDRLIEDNRRELKRQREDRYVQSLIPRLERGDHEDLMYVLYKVSFDWFDGAPPFDEIRQRYGSEVARAVLAGLARYWQHLPETSSLWPLSSSLPNWALVACTAVQTGVVVVDWLALDARQVDLLSWYAVRGNTPPTEVIVELWSHRRAAAWEKWWAVLQLEGQKDDEAHPTTWQHFANIDDLPGGLATALVDAMLTSGLLVNASARRYAFRIAREHGDMRIRALLENTVQAEWLSGAEPIPRAEPAALTTLAAWWLMDPVRVQMVLQNEVFVGPRQRQRAAGFVDALQYLLGGRGFSPVWPADIAWDHYADLLPLFFYGDTAVPKSCPERKMALRALDTFDEARRSLVEHLAKGPAALVHTWFAKWKNDERFGKYRDWLARIHAEVGQRWVDQSWQSLEPRHVLSLLQQGAWLVRNDVDLFTFVCEVVETKMSPIFRSDHGLTTLLWNGTKSEGRVAADEKSLQTAVFNQLEMLTANSPMIGVREPEVFDAKKPDIRVSRILDNGELIHVPVEIKWAHNDEVWTAVEEQLLGKYMLDPRVRHGVYLVGWAGAKHQPKTGPTGQKPSSPQALQSALQLIANAVTDGTEKAIAVFVIDVSILD
jgi:hypothetical protein